MTKLSGPVFCRREIGQATIRHFQEKRPSSHYETTIMFQDKQNKGSKEGGSASRPLKKGTEAKSLAFGIWGDSSLPGRPLVRTFLELRGETSGFSHLRRERAEGKDDNMMAEKEPIKRGRPVAFPSKAQNESNQVLLLFFTGDKPLDRSWACVRRWPPLLWD